MWKLILVHPLQLMKMNKPSKLMKSSKHLISKIKIKMHNNTQTGRLIITHEYAFHYWFTKCEIAFYIYWRNSKLHSCLLVAENLHFRRKFWVLC